MDLNSPTSNMQTGDVYGSSQGFGSAAATSEVNNPDQHHLGVRQRKLDTTSSEDSPNLAENEDNYITCNDVEDFWINKKAYAINRKISRFLKKHSKTLKCTVAIAAVLLYFCYLGAAIYFSLIGALPLIIGTVFVILIIVFNVVSKKSENQREKLKEKWRNSSGPKYTHNVGV